MDDLLEELMLLIINECEPLVLSNLSLINKRYYDFLHGNPPLMLLSGRHDFKFESFEEYQLFCELRYLVPQSSKHYDMNHYQLNIDKFNALSSKDVMLGAFRNPNTRDSFIYCDDDIFNVFLRRVYDDDTHIMGNLNFNNPTVKEIGTIWGSMTEYIYFRYIVRHCPNTKIVVQCWNNLKDKLITDDEDENDDILNEIFSDCMESIYCIERFNWFLSTDPINDPINDYSRMFSISHPYIVHYIINDCSAGFERYMLNDTGLDIYELMTISNNYKHSERVDRLVQKMITLD